MVLQIVDIYHTLSLWWIYRGERGSLWHFSNFWHISLDIYVIFMNFFIKNTTVCYLTFVYFQIFCWTIFDMKFHALRRQPICHKVLHGGAPCDILRGTVRLYMCICNNEGFNTRDKWCLPDNSFHTRLYFTGQNVCQCHLLCSCSAQTVSVDYLVLCFLPALAIGLYALWGTLWLSQCAPHTFVTTSPAPTIIHKTLSSRESRDSTTTAFIAF